MKRIILMMLLLFLIGCKLDEGITENDSLGCKSTTNITPYTTETSVVFERETIYCEDCKI